MFPILLCICMLSQASACWGCKGLLTCCIPPLHLPWMGCMSICLHPPLISWLSCTSVCFRDIYMWYGEYFHYVGGLGVFPICWGFWGHQHMGCPYASSYSSSCLTFLLWLWLLLLWLQWCLPGCHLFHQWPWLLPWWGFLQHWVSMKWLNHHPWCWEALEVLLALPLCCSSNLHLWCLFWLMPIILWVFHR